MQFPLFYNRGSDIQINSSFSVAVLTILSKQKKSLTLHTYVPILKDLVLNECFQYRPNFPCITQCMYSHLNLTVYDSA